MPSGVFFNLTLHNHQPVGNFPWVFEEAYQKAYLPFLELLEAHPRLPANLHYSGPLWEWLKAEHPGFLARLRAAVERGQVELLAGAYYEPILCSIPERDQQAQIREMRRRLLRDVGQEPEGMWLAERVWEPHLPRPMARAGIRYTILDDTHFHFAGLEEGELYGHYVTEEGGHLLHVVPSLKPLRYLMPWRPVEESLEYLRTLASREPRLACMGDDGEKFGLWPETYDSVWGEGWLRELARALEENRSWLWPVRLGDYLRRFPALGRVYLPTASYVEMTQWALPAHRAAALERVRQRLEAGGDLEALAFLRGSFWRSFLVKYPEANRMHKRMLRVHGLVWSLPEEERGEPLEELWKGQCNCPYWHGVFGGVYLPHIRSANWQHLLRAEALAESARRGGGWRRQGEEDLDGDGLPELVLESDRLFLAADPRRGGRLLALDGRGQPWSYLNTVSRRPEGYHSLLRGRGVLPSSPGERGEEPPRQGAASGGGPPEGGDGGLVYDRYERLALHDHFLGPREALERWERAAYRERGDFLDGAFQAAWEEGTLRLWRDGRAWAGSLRLEKSLRLLPGEDAFQVHLALTNTGRGALRGLYGSEWSLALLWGGSPQAGYRLPGRALQDAHLDSRGEEREVSELVAATPPLRIGLRFRLDPPARLWRCPLRTVSSSESGLEEVYQASTLLWLWELSLEEGSRWEARLRLELVTGLEG